MRRANDLTDRRMRDIERRARQGAGNVEGIFARMGASMRAGLIGALGGLGVQQAFNQVRQAAADLAQTMADATRAGLPVEDFQALKFAAEQSRVGVDALVDELKELQLRTDEVITTGGGSAAEAFARLGFTADELARKIQNPVALFDEILSRMRDLDHAAQIRIADEVFGGTGGEQFLQLLQEGSRSIGDLSRKARASGAVLDAEIIAKAVEIDREFNRIATTVGTALKGAIVSAADALRDFLGLLAQSEATVNAGRIGEVQGLIERREGQLAAMRPNDPRRGRLEGVLGELRAERRALEDAQRIIDGGLYADPPAAIAAPAAPHRGGAPVPETGGRGAAKAIVDGYAQVIAAGRERIAQLNLERDTTGLTVAAAAALVFEQEALAKAAKDGIALSAEQRAEIAGLATEYGALTEAVAVVRQEQAALDQVTGRVADGFTDAFTNMITGAGDAQDAIRALLADLGRMLVNRAFTSLIGGALGGAGGGFLGALFGRAQGGPVNAMQPYRVGEFGPETFVPTTPGRIVPAGNGGGGAQTMALTVNVNGARGNTEIMEMVRQGVSQGLSAYDRRLPSRLAYYQKREG